MRGKIAPMNSRDWARPVSTKTRKCVPPILTQREVDSDQDGLMSYGTGHTLPLVFLLSSWIFLDPPGPLRCVAQNPRIPAT